MYKSTPHFAAKKVQVLEFPCISRTQYSVKLLPLTTVLILAFSIKFNELTTFKIQSFKNDSSISASFKITLIMAHMKQNVNTVFLKLTQHWKVNHDDNRLFVHNIL